MTTIRWVINRLSTTIKWVINRLLTTIRLVINRLLATIRLVINKLLTTIRLVINRLSATIRWILNRLLTNTRWVINRLLTTNRLWTAVNWICLVPCQCSCLVHQHSKLWFCSHNVCLYLSKYQYSNLSIASYVSKLDEVSVLIIQCYMT